MRSKYNKTVVKFEPLKTTKSDGCNFVTLFFGYTLSAVFKHSVRWPDIWRKSSWA